MTEIKDSGRYSLPQDTEDGDRASVLQCKYCGGTKVNHNHGPHAGGHYDRITCSSCDRFIKWGSKPKPKKKRKTTSHSELKKLYSVGRCEICLRHERALPLPQTLEVHHIMEVQNGGDDTQSNVQIVCTPCHKWIHHQRTYLGHYNAPRHPHLEAIA